MKKGAGEAGVKCKKCRYFYRAMVTKEGYNPYPCCHLWEDEGKHPERIRYFSE